MGSQQEWYYLVFTVVLPTSPPPAGPGRLLVSAVIITSIIGHLKTATPSAPPHSGPGDCWERLSVLSPEDKEQQADRLRGRVCDELLARRAQVAPLVGGDLDAYVAEMRNFWVKAGGWTEMRARVSGES